MKTRILQLETHDDFLSVRDRLNWVKGGRVLLVWPKRARSLERHLDLVLLQHTCNSLGLQLGLVTKNPDIRFYADELGLPVFDNTRQAQSERWARRHKPQTRPERRHPRPNLTEMRQELIQKTPPWTLHPIIRSILFSLAVLSPIAIALLLIPQARITLIPETRTQSLLLDVAASPSAEMVTLAGALPARPVNVIVGGSDSITVTGTITVPTSYAKGNVQFTNLTDTSVKIPAGSVVSTLNDPPVRFSTRRGGTVAAGPGKTLTLPVDAITTGTMGNVKAGSIVTIEGTLSFQLAVSNQAATSGGKDIMAPAPSAKDRVQLYDQLMMQLQQSATDALQNSLQPGDQLISSAVLTETIEKTYSPPSAQPSTQLSLTLRLQFEGLGVSANDLRQWANAILDANLPDDYTPVASSLEIIQLSTPSLTKQPATWQIEAQRELQAHASSFEEAATHTRWLTISSASEALTSLPLAAPPEISISPSWWPFIPLRIQINSKT